MEMRDNIRKNNEDEISILDVLKKIVAAYRVLKNKWKKILLVAFIFSIVCFTYAWINKPSYEANLSFVLEEESKGSLGSYASLASQFGININGGNSSASGVFSGDNLIELLKSRYMIEQALLTPVQMRDKKNKLLVNYYIDINKLHEQWASNEKFKNFYFNEDRKDFT